MNILPLSSVISEALSDDLNEFVEEQVGRQTILDSQGFDMWRGEPWSKKYADDMPGFASYLAAVKQAADDPEALQEPRFRFIHIGSA